MLKIISRGAADDRRSLKFDAATVIKTGQVIEEVNGKAVLSTGVAPRAPMWAFTGTERQDSKIAGSITAIDGPFIGLVDGDGYVGTPAAGALLAVDPSNHGKLVVVGPSADAIVQGLVVARCIASEVNGFIKIKALA